MLLKLHAKLAPGWALIQVNFDPIQELGPKVGGGHSFMSGPFFTRLRYMYVYTPLFSDIKKLFDISYILIVIQVDSLPNS